MVTQGRNAFNSSENGDEVPDVELIIKWFLDEVKWFAINSCILGVVMLIGTYFSIMLFNVAAHNQVRYATPTAANMY